MGRTLIAVFEICKPRGRDAAAALAGLLAHAILSSTPSPFSSVGGGVRRDPRRRAVCLHFRRRCRKLQTEREGEFQTAAEEEEGEGEAAAGNLQNATAGFAEGVDELAPREWISLNSSRRRGAEVLKHRERGKASTAFSGFVS